MQQVLDSAVTATLLYHKQTKHHFHRYARSAGFLDWANQPNPFRFYEGVSAVRLPLLQTDPPAWPKQSASGASIKPLRRGEGPTSEHLALYERSRNAFQDFTRETIGALLELSLGLSAWKSIPGSTWALRMNPSSGNLHPTEAYLILPALPGVTAGIFHYNSYLHALEPRAEVPETLWQQIKQHLHSDGFLVALTSILWREAWKYGERAFRYCQHDVGHALGSMRFAAAALGWKFRLLDRVASAAVSQLLGLDREADYTGAEREHPELVALVVREKWASDRGLCLSKELVSQVANSRWYGTANALSPEHGVDWPVIDQVAAATANSRIAADEEFSRFPSEEELFGAPVRSGTFSAEKVILGRRSAVSMDGSTAIPAATFFRMLARLVPTRDGRSMPWDALPWRPRIHLGLFVHRVNDVPPGLYVLARDP